MSSFNMIKKNTKIKFIDENNDFVDELNGGIPLSIGEIMRVNRNNTQTDFEVIDKDVEFNFIGDDQIANITYTLKKK